METVGFIGLGRMGSPMAGNIQKAGYPIVVYDVRPEAAKSLVDGGARLAGSPAEVASLSQVTFTSLPGPKEVEEVATGPGGILEGIRSGVYVDLSTCRPSLIRRLEPAFRRVGARVMDAPVQSTPTLALNRNLTAMVGGDREVFDRLQPIFSSFSDRVMYVGDLGSGCVVKLVTNMMGLLVGQVMAEGLTLGVKAGARLEDLLEIGSRPEVGGILGPRRESFSKTWFRGEFDPAVFTLDMARKDITEATEMGRECNVPLPIASVAEQTFIQAINNGWADKNSIISFTVQEERAGVQVRLPEGAR